MLILAETFYITINQMIKLFVFLLCGFFFKKKALSPDTTATVLSKLEVNIFLPCLCFNSFSENFTLSTISEKLPLLGISLIVLGLSFLLSVLLSRIFAKNSFIRDVYVYSYTIPNLGFIGYPLIAAVFGDEMLFNFMVFCIPFNIFIYTAGIYMLNPNKEFTFKKLANPSLIAMFIGMMTGILSIPVPSFLTGITTSASACMAPVAMILTGFVLANSSIRKLFGDIKIYIAAFIRLAVIPLAAFGIFWLTGIHDLPFILSVSLLCLPFGLNSVVFPEAYGGDSTPGAQLCCISNIMGIITIPLIFSLISYVYNN